MAYARLDDRYDDNRKVRRAWRKAPEVVGLHAMAISYCCRHETDGLVDAERMEEWLALLPGDESERRLVLATAVDLELFEARADGDYLVHDFLEYNDSREHRERLRNAGRRGAAARWGRSGHDDGASGAPSGPATSPADAEANADGIGGGSGEANGPPHHTTPHHTTPGGPGDGAPDGDPAAPARRGGRRRRPAPPDPDTLPADLPAQLADAARGVHPILARLATAKGARPVALLAVGRAVEAFPLHDHRRIASDVEHYWTFGPGASRPMRDVVATFRNRLDSVPAAPSPGPSPAAGPVRERDIRRPGGGAA